MLLHGVHLFLFENASVLVDGHLKCDVSIDFAKTFGLLVQRSCTRGSGML